MHNMTLTTKAKPRSDLLTVKEVADILRCHQNTVRNYVKRGVLSPIRFLKTPGAKLFFKVSDISDFINGGQDDGR